MVTTTTTFKPQQPTQSSIVVVKQSGGATPTPSEQRSAQGLLGGFSGVPGGARIGDIVGNARIVRITPQGGIIVQPASAPYSPPQASIPVELAVQQVQQRQVPAEQLFTPAPKVDLIRAPR